MEESNLTGHREICKPIGKNLVERHRQSTDKFFIYLFPIIFTGWFGLVFYGCTIGDSWKHYDNYFKRDFVLDSTWSRERYYNQGSLLVTIIGVCLIFLVLILIILRYLPKCITYVPVILIFLEIASIIVGIGFGAHDLISHIPKYSYVKLFGIFGAMIYIIYSIIGLVCIFKVGIPVLADIVKRTSRAFSSYLIQLISLLLIVIALEIFVVLSTGLAVYVNTPNHPAVISFIVLGGMYIFNFFLCYARMIISPVIATWHWTENKREVSRMLIFKYIREITRKHFGSASFAALPILPFVIALFVACRQRTRETRQTCLNSWAHMFVAINLIWNNFEYAAIVSSVYGRNFCQSTAIASRLLTKSCILSLAVFQIFNTIFVHSILFIAFLITATVNFWSRFHSDSAHYLLDTSKTGVILVVLLILPVFLLLDMIPRIIFLCLLEGEDENSLQDKTEEITSNERLQKD